jgi:hypothetical protein
VSSKPGSHESPSRGRSNRIERNVARATLALADSQTLRDRRRDQWTRDEVRARMRADYLELPGLRLTAAQAARLWLIDRDLAVDVLAELAASGFLHCRDDHYARR